jgi:ubiquinone biosynthesis protein UbiJ
MLGRPGTGANRIVEVTNEYLARMIKARFTVLSKDISATHNKLDMLKTSLNDIAETHATHGEISAPHEEVDRLRRHVSELDARVGELQPPN